MNAIEIQDFLQLSENKIVVDVRSPSEYAAGHLPAAINIPLFNDEERKVVGTLYKQTGRDEAIHKGLEFAGPKLAEFVKKAHKHAPERELFVHCWRGGLRSKNMAWLFTLAGFKVSLLLGGYKAYRNHVRKKLGENNNILVLGGKTGSGKTDILEFVAARGYQVIKLEEIAKHKGSAFGDLGQAPQPTNEQFENNLFAAMQELNANEITWVEDESRGIGRIGIPAPFYDIIRNTELIFLDVPKKNRVTRLVEEYAGFSKERLAAAIQRITKKLGGLNSKFALEALEIKDYHTVADILLLYYDKAYLKGLSFRDAGKVYHLAVEGDHPEKNAGIAIDFYEKNLAGKFRLLTHSN